jgi:uncharacterized membrane protein YkvA (DUF1232 family)
MIKNKEYTKYFEESTFWDKIINIPKSAGKEVIQKAILLYVILTHEDVPLWVKASIIAALGYFICPIDAVPDIIPFAGYLDDLAVLTLLIGEVSVYETENVKKKVAKLLPEWMK